MRALVGAWLVVLGLALAARADEPGDSRFVGQHWFQHLGVDEQGRAQWLYPHIDGVPEVFVATERGWVGAFESRYDPATGTFTRRFSAVEVLNELRATDAARTKRRAARLLTAFLALYPSPEGPYHLREARPGLAELLEPEDVTWVQETLAAHRAAVARVKSAGTRVASAPASLLTAADHQRALIQDGYLDIAVVGGNSQDPDSEQRYSWDLVAELALELERAGYARAAFREAEDATIREKTIGLLGATVRVRVQLTGGSARGDRTRRAIANFVEGLARADVVIYLGHSNRDSGAYYLSEKKTGAARFRIGAAAEGEDLALKLHDLGRRPHQLVLFQSCSSYPKYCQPLAVHCADGQAPGLLGTTRVAYFDEFVPRFGALLKSLTAGDGAASLYRAVLAAPVREGASPLILRGALQPRRTFVVPRGVEIESSEERGAEEAYLVVGRGTDGREYLSSEVFPQDRPGDVVQVVACGRSALGLRRDGRLLRVGIDTEGSCVPASAKDVALRFVAAVTVSGKEQLVALDAAGRVFVQGSSKAVEPLEPPAPLRAVVIGNDLRGRLVARDVEGRAAVWRGHSRTWERTPAVELVSAPPSLASGADLWVGGRVVPVDAGWEP